VPVQTAGFPYLNNLDNLRRLHRPGHPPAGDGSR
jgi:hypothetical protein